MESWLGVERIDFDEDGRSDVVAERETDSVVGRGSVWVGWGEEDNRSDADNAETGGEASDEDVSHPSDGALFPGQIVREGEKQVRSIIATRLKQRDDGSFFPTELETVKQKDIVERFELPADGQLPSAMLDRLAEQAPPVPDPVPPIPSDEVPVDVDVVADQAAKEANTAEFLRWSEMSKSQRRNQIRERRRRRREIKEARIAKALDTHFEIACAVMKDERVRKLLARENDAKGHILATEEEIAQGLFKESDRKELACSQNGRVNCVPAGAHEKRSVAAPSVRPPSNLPVEVYPGLRASVFVRIQRAVYGLKDAPKVYTSYFKKKVSSLGWTEIAESILVRKNKKGEIVALLVMRVDDLFSFSPSIDKDVKQIQVLELFDTDQPEKMDNGELHSYVGISIRMRPSKMLLDQSTYIEEMVKGVSEEAKKPLTEKDFLLSETAETDMSLQEQQQKNVGCLGWAVKTQPSLSFLFSHLSRFNSRPSRESVLASEKAL
uniref:Reverse transcriptase Ty1/copia-type domain-containing protein n=1 Tax=Chromera velia CCMP2878 TaxID=1169474 RepID=A0A0G4HDZ3_9ALVE|eukprot:Cvel_6507.t1-p1 / transcript=Cvel_6507.t1 / gene=Cvel_6507 / organism=Chromera_velia_CCMP2878 / gene_product=hypothetical protein / transcript_product=hypothetical protein / location=Cvel_scaffold319:62757-64555(+) / protein_length=493 / sequence_SO=supercontig / SO=protein_coding / is_pseudo=false